MVMKICFKCFPVCRAKFPCCCLPQRKVHGVWCTCVLCIALFTLRALKDFEYTNLIRWKHKVLRRGLSVVRMWSSSEGHCSDVTGGRLVASHQQRKPAQRDCWLIFTRMPEGLSSHPWEGESAVSPWRKPPSNPDTIWFLLAALGLTRAGAFDSVAPADAFSFQMRVCAPASVRTPPTAPWKK